MKVNSKTIGKRICQRRKEMHLKQKDLAELLDISNNHLSSIETGASMPSLELFIKICDKLKVSPDFILLGSIHSNNLPQNICDKISRCTPEKQQILDEIVNIFMKKR